MNLRNFTFLSLSLLLSLSVLGAVYGYLTEDIVDENPVKLSLYNNSVSNVPLILSRQYISKNSAKLIDDSNENKIRKLYLNVSEKNFDFLELKGKNAIQITIQATAGEAVRGIAETRLNLIGPGKFMKEISSNSFGMTRFKYANVSTSREVFWREFLYYKGKNGSKDVFIECRMIRDNIENKCNLIFQLRSKLFVSMTIFSNRLMYWQNYIRSISRIIESP